MFRRLLESGAVSVQMTEQPNSFANSMRVRNNAVCAPRLRNSGGVAAVARYAMPSCTKRIAAPIARFP